MKPHRWSVASIAVGLCCGLIVVALVRLLSGSTMHQALGFLLASLIFGLVDRAIERP